MKRGVTIEVQKDIHQELKAVSAATGKKVHRITDDILRPALIPNKKPAKKSK